MPYINLKSSDDQVFSVDVKAAQRSITIKRIMEDTDFTTEDREKLIPIPNVSGSILEKIIDWITHHKDDPPYVEGEDETIEQSSEEIGQWNQEFLQVENETLIAITNAAYYLDIKPLADICCKTVANIIKGKTNKEIHEAFKRTSDEDVAAGGGEKSVPDGHGGESSNS